jgi:hypothetical protein
LTIIVPKEQLRAGIARFEDIEQRLRPLLEELLSCMPRAVRTNPAPENAGVYLFSEEERPLYVGQTRNFQRRGDHTQPAKGHNSAPFAFNIARREAMRHGIDVSGDRD